MLQSSWVGGRVLAECWYEDLKDFTFATAFMPVSKAQATALVHHYQHHQLSRTDALTPDDEAQLVQLEAELAHAMEEMKASSSTRRELQGEGQGKEEVMGFFVRLSSRSPKDAGLSEGHPRIMEYLTEELDRFGGLAAADPNQKTVAMQRAAGRILRVTDAKQALWLLVNRHTPPPHSPQIQPRTGRLLPVLRVSCVSCGTVSAHSPIWCTRWGTRTASGR